MGTIETYFFDTYAFFKIIDGDSSYKRYGKDVAIVTTRLNLMELHYGLLIKKGKEIANHYYDRLVGFAIDVDDQIIKQANSLRAAFRQKKLSYIDCIGYTSAKLSGIKFLTGDKQFKDMENVEYVE